MREQSVKCGTSVISESITRLDLSICPFKLWTEGNESTQDMHITADSVIVATGATARRLFIKGEDQYWNQGMSACAVCDGPAPIFRGKPLAVIGGGDSAAEEATFLSKYGTKVYLIHRRDELRASKVMAERVMKNSKIEVLWNKKAVEAKGDGKLLNGVVLEDTKTGEQSELAVNGLFYAIGHDPNTSIIS